MSCQIAKTEYWKIMIWLSGHKMLKFGNTIWAAQLATRPKSSVPFYEKLSTYVSPRVSGCNKLLLYFHKQKKKYLEWKYYFLTIYIYSVNNTVFTSSELAESPQDLSSGALLDKESYNEDDSKSEEPSSPPSTPQSLPSGSNRPPPPLIPFSPKSSSAGKVALRYLQNC